MPLRSLSSKIHPVVSSTIRPRLCLAALASALLTFAATPSLAGAAPSYVSLGDSYTSGPFILPFASGAPLECLQSARNYPHLTAAALGLPAFFGVLTIPVTSCNLGINFVRVRLGHVFIFVRVARLRRYRETGAHNRTRYHCRTRRVGRDEARLLTRSQRAQPLNAEPRGDQRIVSRDDHSREKISFYEKVGVRELLIIDRDPWQLELFRLASGRLESAGIATQSNALSI